MEYTIRFCPKCNGELHIPQNLKTCICMYCGENIEIKEKIPGADSEVKQKIVDDYNNTLDDISKLLDGYELYLNHFTRDKYKSSFEKYVKTGRAILLPIERYAVLLEDNLEEVIQKTAIALIAAINKSIREQNEGLKRALKVNQVYQYRFFLTVFTIPMLLELHLGISETLADRILAEWGTQFPKDTFQKANYAELAAGFDRKGLCFITSAACNVMGKSDDCYELTTFRSFRDTYMMQTEGRKSLVEEYYRIAPAIVVYINTLQESKQIYKQLWKDFLQPCLKYIENNRLEECEILYTQMLQDVRKNYNII